MYYFTFLRFQTKEKSCKVYLQFICLFVKRYYSSFLFCEVRILMCRFCNIYMRISKLTQILKSRNFNTMQYWVLWNQEKSLYFIYSALKTRATNHKRNTNYTEFKIRSLNGTRRKKNRKNRKTTSSAWKFCSCSHMLMFWYFLHNSLSPTIRFNDVDEHGRRVRVALRMSRIFCSLISRFYSTRNRIKMHTHAVVSVYKMRHSEWTEEEKEEGGGREVYQVAFIFRYGKTWANQNCTRKNT